MSRFAIATAAETGWPPKVMPWVNILRVVEERLRHAVRHDHGAHRRVGRGDALGGGDQVRHDAEAVDAEVVAEPAPGADHLVRDQQHVVAVADLAHALPVAVLRDEAAPGVLHRLEDDRGNRVRVLELDHVLDLLGGPERVAVLCPAVVVGVGCVVGARYERLERRAQRSDARDRERPEGRAVVGGLARDDLVLRRGPAELVVLASHLPRRLDGLGAARGEEDAVEVARCELGDARGQLDRHRVGVAPVRVEAELLGLAGRGLAELGAPVAGVHAEQGGQPVHVAVAVIVVHVRPLAAHDQRDLVTLVVPAHPGEVHPEMPACPLLELAGRTALRIRYGLWGRRQFSLLASVRLDAADNGIGAMAGRLGSPWRNASDIRCTFRTVSHECFRQFAPCGDAGSAIACRPP